MIRLYVKIPENFVRLIFLDGFWIVRIVFVRMVKFKFLAQFPVDHLPQPVVSCLKLFFALTYSIKLCDWWFIYHYFTPWEFFTSTFADGLSLELIDNKSPQVPRTLLSILADLNNAAIWMVSTCPFISKLSCPCTIPLVTVPKHQLQLVPPLLSCSTVFSIPEQGPGTYLSSRLSFSGQSGQQSLQFDRFFLFLLAQWIMILFYTHLKTFLDVWNFVSFDSLCTVSLRINKMCLFYCNIWCGLCEVISSRIDHWLLYNRKAQIF